MIFASVTDSPRASAISRRLAVVLVLAGGFIAVVPPPLLSEPALRRLGLPGRASIYSADHRFMVTGMSSAENLVLVGHLAELASQVEASTGMPLPFQRDQVMGVMVQSTPSPDSQLLKMQGWDGNQFYQRLIVPGVPRLDTEDLVGAACWLMLNRYVAEYTPKGQRTGMGAVVPDWISSGIAQNTQAALYARNREWISNERAEGRVMSLYKVIKQEVLPPGRWREKAYAAAAVEFLFPEGDRTTWAMLMKAVGTRQAVDAAWLRAHSPALLNQNPEQAWRAFLKQRSQSRTVDAWGDRGLQIENKLLTSLNFSPRELAADVPADVPADLYARDLITYRGQKWTIPVAGSLSLQVQSLRLGAPAALQGVLISYAAFFDQLRTPPEPKRSWWRRSKKDSNKRSPPDDASWQVALNQLWMRAERTHQAYLESHQSRKRYVDSFDHPDSDSFDEFPASLDDAPRTRLQQAVDTAEEEMNQNPF